MTKLSQIREKAEKIEEICELFDEIGFVGVARVFPVEGNEVCVSTNEIERALRQFKYKIEKELSREEESFGKFRLL